MKIRRRDDHILSIDDSKFKEKILEWSSCYSWFDSLGKVREEFPKEYWELVPEVVEVDVTDKCTIEDYGNHSTNTISSSLMTPHCGYMNLYGGRKWRKVEAYVIQDNISEWHSRLDWDKYKTTCLQIVEVKS